MSNTVKLIFTFSQIIIGLFLVVTIILQSGKRAGLSGAISGMADTFLSKNSARTWDARLAKMTKWVAAVFILITLVLNFNSFSGT